MESILPIAAFAERAQLSRRTIERKIAIGEIGADYVQRRGRRVFIDAAALATLAPDLSRHDATQQRPAAKPPDSPPELISTLRESLRRERERAGRKPGRRWRSRSGARCSATSAKPPRALSCCNAS
jgi:hypothetical protein